MREPVRSTTFSAMIVALFIQRSITANPEELAAKAGKGKVVNGLPLGSAGCKERVDFGRVIGEYISKEGVRASTTKGMIIYAKDGSIHIVPAAP